MGPVIILDKSAFQSFSRREHLSLHIHFLENPTPILAMELLADLKKPTKNAKSPEQKVQELAAKFGGSGPPSNEDYRTICVNALLGRNPPLDGRMMPQNSRQSRASDGSRGVIVGPSEFNEAIMRWANGQFMEFEHQLATYWREKTHCLDPVSFKATLDRHEIIIPRCRDLTEVNEYVEQLSTRPEAQLPLLQWLMRGLAIPIAFEGAIFKRWLGGPEPVLLKEFAPYAWHCARVLLLLVGATRNELVEWNSTNLLDAQYLYYLPFCMVFTSNDRLHKALAPILVRDNQSFVHGEELKADLAWLATFRDLLTIDERIMLSYALGDRPPPVPDSIAGKLWRKHMRPWSASNVNHASSLSALDRAEAIRTVTEMYHEADESRKRDSAKFFGPSI